MVQAEPEQHFSILPDPIGDRNLSDERCPRLINRPAPDNVLWKEDGLPNWQILKDYLAREGPISKSQIMRLLMATLQLL